MAGREELLDKYRAVFEALQENLGGEPGRNVIRSNDQAMVRLEESLMWAMKGCSSKEGY